MVWDKPMVWFWIRDINGNGRQYLEQQFKALEASGGRYTSFEIWANVLILTKQNYVSNIDRKQAMANGWPNRRLTVPYPVPGATVISMTLLIAAGLNNWVMGVMLNSVPSRKIWHSGMYEMTKIQMVPFNDFSQVGWSGWP